MIFKNMIKFSIFILFLSVIYFRDHYYLFIFGLGLLLIYKFNIHIKIYNILNKLTGNTNMMKKDRSKKSKYLKKFKKSSGGEM